VAGLLLAAGESRRLGQAKQLLTDAHGVPLVVRAMRLLLDAGCAPVIVVLGAHHEAVHEVLIAHGADNAGPLPVHAVRNVAWADGMGTSIACGVSYLLSGDVGADALLIAPCDMPGLTVSHAQSLVATFRDRWHPDADIRPPVRVASMHARGEAPEVSVLAGQDAPLGIPAVLPRSDFPTLAALRADHGARQLLRAVGTVAVALGSDSFDLDTADDVARWRRPPLA
jgi:molybdenum cofactor cytidylyltransferase